MSGGGKSVSWSEDRTPTTTGDGGGGGADPCDITSLTNLNSPNVTVLGTLRPGDVLGVQLQSGPPRILVAVSISGQVVGSITSPEMPRIIGCIQKGVGYAAEVITVRGGICQVRVQRQ